MEGRQVLVKRRGTETDPAELFRGSEVRGDRRYNGPQRGW